LGDIDGRRHLVLRAAAARAAPTGTSRTTASPATRGAGLSGRLTDLRSALTGRSLCESHRGGERDRYSSDDHRGDHRLHVHIVLPSGTAAPPIHPVSL